MRISDWSSDVCSSDLSTHSVPAPKIASPRFRPDRSQSRWPPSLLLSGGRTVQERSADSHSGHRFRKTARHGVHAQRHHAGDWLGCYIRWIDENKIEALMDSHAPVTLAKLRTATHAQPLCISPRNGKRLLRYVKD